MYTINSILEIIPHVRATVANPALGVAILDYDSRKIREGGNSLFFALSGVRDGHDFLSDAYENGVRSFVVSDHHLDITSYIGANFIWVHDTWLALQTLAAYHRKSFDMPVVGITGSNGKTTVKEWLHQMIAIDKDCYESPKSYNSQLGVALALWELEDHHELALIEAGISQKGEMSRLEKMIQPDIGVFTAIGTAHADGFASQEEKIDEKWKLFAGVRHIVGPANAIPDHYRDQRCFLWGNSAQDDIQIVDIELYPTHTQVHLREGTQTRSIQVPFTDQASVDNALTCMSVMRLLVYDWQIIQERVAHLQPLDMRLKLKKGKRNCSIIDDSYSNDLSSLQIALDFLRQQNQHRKKSLVLTDFVGILWDEKFKSKLVALLQELSFQRLILIGSTISDLRDRFGPDTAVFCYETTADLIAGLTDLNVENETILIKGARKFALEKLINLLTQKSHDTVLEIHLKAIEHNLSQYRARLQPGVKLMAMVKAFSYGSGSFEIANVLQFNKVDYLTVAFADEGVELRQGGIQLPIMVMSPHEETFEDLIFYDLEPEIYSVRFLKLFVAFLEKKKFIGYPIHIKLDTGMHRLGFMPDEMEQLLAIIMNTTTVKVRTVLSHLVGAGNPALDYFTDEQTQLFREQTAILEQRLGYPVVKHIVNTNGIVYRPQDQMDMARLGIGLYGVETAPNGLDLQEVGNLKTTVTQIKHLRAGQTVGYDRNGKLNRDSKIATVKIGYADGYDRRFGNGVGQMSIHGHLVPTLGNVCMDMCMLDVTETTVQEGDEVLVFPDIIQAARQIGTIPYELLTGISSRVKRVYYYE